MTTTSKVGLDKGFRSGLEEINADFLKRQDHTVQYEFFKLVYTKPAKPSKYTPDFPLLNCIVVETKGRFVTADRQKHILIKQQHPGLDLRFVFDNPKQRISKTSKTTYAMWCEKNGFKFAKKLIPQEWLSEPAHPAAVQAFYKAFGSLPKDYKE